MFDLTHQQVHTGLPHSAHFWQEAVIDDRQLPSRSGHRSAIPRQSWTTSSSMRLSRGFKGQEARIATMLMYPATAGLIAAGNVTAIIRSTGPPHPVLHPRRTVRFGQKASQRSASPIPSCSDALNRQRHRFPRCPTGFAPCGGRRHMCRSLAL